ncbi:hypothetical protein DsansV1_C18g0153061 [Dioscorea sansibarensis]
MEWSVFTRTLSNAKLEHIDSSFQRLMSLSRKLRSIYENISCDPAYVSTVGFSRIKFIIGFRFCCRCGQEEGTGEWQCYCRFRVE